MNILSQNGKILVNYNNVASLYIQKKYMQYSHPDTWWEIRAMYFTTPKTTSYDILATFEDEKECRRVFSKIVELTGEKKVDFIAVGNI